jgi:hypothetical protein
MGWGTVRQETKQGAGGEGESTHPQPKSHPEPNNRLQLTPSSLRYAAAFGRG